jgi:hypothetical protein
MFTRAKPFRMVVNIALVKLEKISSIFSDWNQAFFGMESSIFWNGLKQFFGMENTCSL